MCSAEDYYHTMAGCGPWYEMDGPKPVEALNLIISHSRIKDKFIPEWVIMKNINHEIEIVGGLGSWRGFHTFTLTSIVDRCVGWYETEYNKAMKVLIDAKCIKNWINHILYRYPDKDSPEKLGLRVKFHKDSFNEQKKNI